MSTLHRKVITSPLGGHMEYAQALSQIHLIHEHLAKGEIFRGYRPLPVALTGLLGLAAAALQSHVITGAPLQFTCYWAAVAAICICVGGGPIVQDWIQQSDAYARRRTWKVVGQFLPCIFAGAVVTAALMARELSRAPLLPGLWAILFGLGIFSSRPYLPRASGWVALYYLAAGGLLLWTGDGAAGLSGWRVGGVFGTGQLMCGLVLYRNVERADHV